MGKLSTLWLSVLILLVSACSKTEDYVYVDDTPSSESKVVLTVTDANGNVSKLTKGSKLGVYMTNSVGSVTFLTAEVGQDGNIVLPTSTQATSIAAYQPFQESWGSNADLSALQFSVAADQSTEEGYNASDLMVGMAQTGNPVEIQLKHVLAQMVINIVDEAGANDFLACGVVLRDMCDAVVLDVTALTVTTQSSSVADIKMLPYVVSDHRLSLKAIVAPQQKSAGERFIVFTNNNYSRRYAIPEVANLEGGKTYTYNMRLTETGLEFVGSTITGWDEEGEISLDI